MANKARDAVCLTSLLDLFRFFHFSHHTTAETTTCYVIDLQRMTSSNYTSISQMDGARRKSVILAYRKFCSE